MINLNLIPPVLKKEILETWGKSDEQPMLRDLPFSQLKGIQDHLLGNADHETQVDINDILWGVPPAEFKRVLKELVYKKSPFVVLDFFQSYLNVELEEAWETWGGEQP